MCGLHVLVAGAGIGGLTAALALLKRGIDVDVYEQAGELREVGAGLQLGANGSRVPYALGLGPDLEPLADRSAQPHRKAVAMIIMAAPPPR